MIFSRRRWYDCRLANCFYGSVIDLWGPWQQSRGNISLIAIGLHWSEDLQDVTGCGVVTLRLYWLDIGWTGERWDSCATR